MSLPENAHTQALGLRWCALFSYPSHSFASFFLLCSLTLWFSLGLSITHTHTHTHSHYFGLDVSTLISPEFSLFGVILPIQATWGTKLEWEINCIQTWAHWPVLLHGPGGIPYIIVCEMKTSRLSHQCEFSTDTYTVHRPPPFFTDWKELIVRPGVRMTVVLRDTMPKLFFLGMNHIIVRRMDSEEYLLSSWSC